MTAPPATDRLPPPRALRLGGALLVLLVAAIYGQTLGHGFVSWDDPAYITANRHVAGGLSGAEVAWAFTHAKAANYHPLTWVSHMVDVELFGMWAGGHHLVSALLHAASAVLLFVALSRMTGRWAPSLAVAALFAVHPLRVESVAWAAERKDVLSGLGFMLVLLAYEAHARRPRPGSFAWVALALAAGLLAKPMLVTAPFALLVLDAWPLRRWRGAPGAGGEGLGAGALLREKAWLLALAAGAAGATVWAQGRAGSMMSAEQVPLDVRLANVPLAYVGYLGKALWPVDLSLFYPLRGEVDAGATLGAVALLVLVSAVVVARRRAEPSALAGWLLFLGMLVPVIGLVQVGTQAMADRYAYLPLVGLEVLAVFGVARAAEGRRAAGRVAVVLAVLVVAALAVRAHDQAGVWRDDEALYTHALDLDPENPVAHNNLGLVRLARGDVGGAVEAFQRTTALAAGFTRGWVNLGVARRAAGDLAGARAALDHALGLEGGDVKALTALADLLVEEGQLDAADRRLRRLERLAPGRPPTHTTRGRWWLARGRSDEALAAFERALALDPSDPVALRGRVEARGAERAGGP